MILILMNGCSSSVSSDSEDVKVQIIALEKQAMDMWSNGNPDGFLDLSSDDVVYIDPFFEQKLEGKKALTDYYNTIRGQVKMGSYEMIKPVVQLTSDVAVLTYNFVSHGGNDEHRWNCTEVYNLNSQNQWKIIHTHWSFVRPDK
jgi:ketosteroid isomerase-like protein